MKGKMYWHVHHDTLLEWCWSAKERREYIRRNKPEDEIAIRLKLMKPVKGKLPKEFIEADKKRVEADKKWVEADKKWVEAYRKHFATIKKLHDRECGCSWTKEHGIDFNE